MGKLIAIEGLDGSGKSTQIELLAKRLEENGIEAKTVSFPNYESDSSALVKMYLGGEFGSNAGDVNAYTASLFFAVDRFASFRTGWQEYFDNGGVVVSARYTTSNAIHQTSKLPENQWDEYLDWLFDTEFCKMSLPKPDLVIFLDMPPEVSQKMLSGRYEGDESKKDIHERDTKYLENCRKAAKYIADKYNWLTVNCAEKGEPRTRADISDEIFEAVKKAIGR